MLWGLRLLLGFSVPAK
jgi:cyclopropane fatty-acyl-phospholipid synthase-like methyltransferase